MSEELYEVTLRNVPFRQARALYRFLVNLDDTEEFHGGQGMAWSGMIAGKCEYHTEGDVRFHTSFRTITINPMPTHEQVSRERDMRELARQLYAIINGETHPNNIRIAGGYGLLLVQTIRKLARRANVGPWA